MKKFTAFSLIFMLFFSNIAYNVSAAVNVGEANSILKGDYVVIVNTNLENSQSTGNIIFDDSGLNIRSIDEDIDELSEENFEMITLDNNEEGISTNALITTTYKIGDQKRIGPTEATKKTYTLIGEGSKCYIWMENSIKTAYDQLGKTNLAASEMIKVYEGAPYEILNELANNNIPYLDNSGKLSILIENTGGSTGYYYGEKDITAIHVNAKSASEFKAGSFDGLNGLLAHEGQHALFNILTCKGNANLAHEYSWINEGISVAVMDKVWGYYDNNGWLTRINDSKAVRNGSSLLYSDYRNTTVQDYSMPYLFVRYLAAQATNNGNPIEFLKKIYTMDATNKSTEVFMNEIISNITNLSGKTFKDVLGSFYVAAFSPEKTGEYSFYGDTIVTDKVTSYPIYMGQSNKAMNLEPTAAIVVKTLNGSFTVPSNAGKDIKFYVVSKDNDIYKPTGGSGTASDPYIITNENELNSLGKYPTAYFKLGKNIEITKDSFFTIENFSGNLNGNGYSINNLNKPLINKNNGVINNLIINTNVDMEVMYNFGVVANTNTGLITDVKVSGSINIKGIGNNFVAYPVIGGIAGENQPSGKLERVSFEGDLNVNMPANSTVVGGIAGYNMGAVKNTYAKGNITVSQNNSGSFILNLGGLIGRHRLYGSGATLKNSYSIMSLNYSGQESITKTVGSLVGSIINNATITNSYGRDECNPIGTDSTNVIGKTPLESFKKQETFSGFDFNAIWKMDTTGDKTPIFKSTNDITVGNGKLGYNTFFIGEKLILGPWDTLSVNGKNIELTEDMLNMSEFDSSKVGNNKVINGSYMGQSFTVTYNIVAPSKISNLQIVEKGKVDYYVGEKYSDKGVVLKANLDDSVYDTYIYSGYTNNLSNPLTSANNSVTINYCGQAVNQSITVKEKSISGITVYNNADKSTYVPGNTVDLNGIRYQITYNDGSKSRVLGYSDLNNYNLKVAQTTSDGKNAKAFDLTKKLEANDNNTSLHIYYGDILPGQTGAISGEVLNLSVTNKLYMEDKTFRLVKGKTDGYWESEPLQNANYDVKTTLKSGSLPPGITTYSVPNNTYSDYFGFDGTPTTLGKYVVTYTITKLDGSDSIDVTFTFNVEEVSKEPLLAGLTLKQSNNPSLPYDIEGVIDDVNNTIKFKVPYGTDVTKLKPIPTYYKNSSLPQHLWNGNTVDFSKPVPYEVTAEDGVTKKTYIVSVEVLPEGMEYEAEDVNKDGVINILDLSKVAFKYNIDNASDLFEEDLDINKDNIIDIFDLVLVSRKIDS